jgi:hypothetical protein
MQQIFNIEKKYKLDLHCGDTLKMDTKKVFGIDKFDIIMGNPPYQDGSGNKGNKLWTKFVEMSIEHILKHNGYLVFVHPSLWRQLGHKTQSIMTSKQIEYLEIHNEKDGMKTFKANTRYDWYVIRNIEYKHATKICDEEMKKIIININKMKFIPNKYFELISKLTSGDDKIDVLHSESIYEPRKQWMSGSKTAEFKYPCIYSINRDDRPSLKYSKFNDKGHFGVPKVIWGGGASGFIKDDTGKYGMTQWASAIVDDVDKLEKIYNALKSDNFQKIIRAISVSKQEINYKIMKEFDKTFYKIVNNDTLFNELMK